MSIISKYEDDIYHCTRCGLCQAVCPVFSAVKNELSVTRGKVALLRGILSNRLEFTPKIAAHLELCTGCLACQEFCPSGVSSDKIFLAAKEFFAEKYGLSFPKQAIVNTFSSHKALSFLSTILNLYTTVKAGLLANYVSVSLPFIDKFKLLNSQLTEKSDIKLEQVHIRQAKPTFKLIYYPGCINKYVNSSIAQASLELLKRNNCEVIIPKGFLCCGMPAKNTGALPIAKGLARENLNIFSKEDIKKWDYIVVDCASCGAMLKSYPDLFEDDAEKADYSSVIKDKVIDINKLATMLDIKFPETKEQLNLTYHDPCHLKRSQNIYKEPRYIIQNIKGVNLIEMQGADTCCGAAGSFCITHSDVSNTISVKKAQNILNTNADIVLTSCPSCKVGLSQGLLSLNKPMKILHPVELLYQLNKQTTL